MKLTISELEAEKVIKYDRDEIKFFILNGEILFCHGSENGQMSIDDEYLFEIYDSLKQIICCYPARVKRYYQRLGFSDIAEKLLYPDCDKQIIMRGQGIYENYAPRFVLSFEPKED